MKSFIYLPMILTTIAAFLYPGWVKDGYLGFYDSDLIYPTVGAFIATYGGLIASYTWWYKEVWKKRKK
jgi:hypothetical protein